jgi:hypothetical protein
LQTYPVKTAPIRKTLKHEIHCIQRLLNDFLSSRINPQS